MYCKPIIIITDILFYLFFPSFSRTFGNRRDLIQFWKLFFLNNKVCLVSLEYYIVKQALQSQPKNTRAYLLLMCPVSPYALLNSFLSVVSLSPRPLSLLSHLLQMHRAEQLGTVMLWQIKMAVNYFFSCKVTIYFHKPGFYSYNHSLFVFSNVYKTTTRLIVLTVLVM